MANLPIAADMDTPMLDQALDVKPDAPPSVQEAGAAVHPSSEESSIKTAIQAMDLQEDGQAGIEVNNGAIESNGRARIYEVSTNIDILSCHKSVEDDNGDTTVHKDSVKSESVQDENNINDGGIKIDEHDKDIVMVDEDTRNREETSPILTTPSTEQSSKTSNMAQVKVTPAKRANAGRVAPTAAKRPKSNPWSAENLLQKPKSKLIGVNLKGLLGDDRAWTSLSGTDQAELIAMIPKERQAEMTTSVDGQLRLNNNALMLNEAWTYFIERAVEDIANGRNDPQWLNEAASAHAQRKAGAHDNWKDEQYEKFWGIKQRLASNVVAGTSANHSLQEMIERCVVKPGDVFKYRRNMKREGSLVKIEKDIEFIGMVKTPEYQDPVQRYRFASGTRVIPKGDDSDLIVDDCYGPESIGTKAIKIHGEWVERIPNGNAWKNIRLIRHNQDLGTIWDVRQSMHFAEAENVSAKKRASARKPSKVASATPDSGDVSGGKVMPKRRGGKPSKAAIDNDVEVEDVVKAKPVRKASKALVSDEEEFQDGDKPKAKPKSKAKPKAKQPVRKASKAVAFDDDDTEEEVVKPKAKPARKASKSKAAANDAPAEKVQKTTANDRANNIRAARNGNE